MKKLLLLLLFVPILSFSQNLDYENNFESIRLCTAIQGLNFSTQKSADEALDKILKSIGAAKRFVIQPCSNINNAVALSYKGVRYIMYDPEFMSELSYSNDWANMFILAHEVGHHVNGHSIDVVLAATDVVEKVPLFQKRIQELEADEFAGFVLGRLGASFFDIESVFSDMSDADDTYSTHPKRSKRINAARKGYQDSGGKIASNVSKNKLSVKSKYSNKKYLDVEYAILSNYYSNGRYEGTVGKNGVPFGVGKQIMDNGDIYEGEMGGGKRNGYGVLTDGKNGDIYEGEWVNGQFTGYGVVKFGSGAKYIGDWVNFTLANGKKQFANGSILEGIHNGRIIIKGLYYENADSKPLEVGFLDNSNGNGNATYTYLDGSTLESYFRNGLVFSDENNFSDFMTRTEFGKPGKIAVKYWSSIVFPGIVNSLSQHFDVMGLEKKRNGECCKYMGVNLVYGIEKTTNGFIYKGYFLHGTQNKAGYGEVIYAKNDDRKSYYGMWYNDEKNGFGILTYKNGREESGIFKDNNFIKKEKFNLRKIQEYAKRFY